MPLRDEVIPTVGHAMQLKLLTATVIFLATESVLAQQVSPVWQVKRSSLIHCMDFSPDDATLAVAYRDRYIELCDVASGSARVESIRQKSSVVHLQFSPDGNSIATIDDKETFTIWDNTLHNQLMQWNQPKANCFQFKKDGGSIVVGGWGGTLDLVEIIDRSKDRTVKKDITTKSVAWSPDGKLIACGHWPDAIVVLQVATLKQVFETERHRKYFPYVAFSPDSETLAIGGYDEVVLTNIENSIEPIRLKADLDGVSQIGFSPNGILIAAIDFDSTTLWDLRSQTVIATIPHQQDPKNSIQVSMAIAHNGKYLALSNSNGISMWNLP